MKFNELQTTRARRGNRVGRGIAAGQGKTAGRGTKGQKSRTGSSKKPGFEGGSTPLMVRLPKLRGFRSFKTKAENVYTGQLEGYTGKVVTSAVLADAGLISNAHVNVKLVVKGELTTKVTVELQAASASAIAVVEAAGGTFTKVAQNGRPVVSETKKAKREAKK